MSLRWGGLGIVLGSLCCRSEPSSSEQGKGMGASKGRQVLLGAGGGGDKRDEPYGRETTIDSFSACKTPCRLRLARRQKRMFVGGTGLSRWPCHVLSRWTGRCDLDEGRQEEDDKPRMDAYPEKRMGVGAGAFLGSDGSKKRLRGKGHRESVSRKSTARQDEVVLHTSGLGKTQKYHVKPWGEIVPPLATPKQGTNVSETSTFPTFCLRGTNKIEQNGLGPKASGQHSLIALRSAFGKQNKRISTERAVT